MTTATIGSNARHGSVAPSTVADLARGLLLVALVAGLTLVLVTGGRLIGMVRR